MTGTQYYQRGNVTLLNGDAAEILAGRPAESVDCVVTSPPYWGLRDYGVPGQYGQEPTPEAYVENLRRVFSEARRVLAVDGTLWLNLGDTYGGSWNNYVAPHTTSSAIATSRRDRHGRLRPPQSRQPYKSLLGMPWRVALALIEDGWILRNAIVWHKPNATPESAADRLPRRYEMLFLLARSRRYWFDRAALGAVIDSAAHSIRADGSRRNGTRSGTRSARTGAPGDVWTLPAQPYVGGHFAVGPKEIPRRCIAAGCRPRGVVCDPFSGAGTTGVAAVRLGRRYVGIDLNPAFHDQAIDRITAMRRHSNLAGPPGDEPR